MHEKDHAHNGDATTPNAHQEPNQDRPPLEPSTDGGRRKPGGPIFPLQSDPNKPDQPGSGS